MNTNCPNCDDPACDAKEAFEAWAQEPANGNALQRRFDSNRRCLANRVDWRARALTEAARADAAEARIADAIVCAKALSADADANYAKSSTGDYEVGITDAATQVLAALEIKP